MTETRATVRAPGGEATAIPEPFTLVWGTSAFNVGALSPSGYKLVTEDRAGGTTTSVRAAGNIYLRGRIMG